MLGFSPRGTKALVGFAISAFFVALAVWSLAQRGVSLEHVLDRLAEGDYRWIGVYVAVLFLLQALRILRCDSPTSLRLAVCHPSPLSSGTWTGPGDVQATSQTTLTSTNSHVRKRIFLIVFDLLPEQRPSPLLRSHP